MAQTATITGQVLMTITRRAFLIATTAFTTINLYFPMASAEIDPDNLNRTRWYAVWFQPMDKDPVKLGDFTGIEKYNLPEGTSLTFSEYDRWKIKTARLRAPVEDRTIHMLPEISEYVPDENLGVKEMLITLQAYNPDLDKQIRDIFTESDGSMTVIQLYAKHVSEHYGIDAEGRRFGREFWGELEQAIRGE